VGTSQNGVPWSPAGIPRKRLMRLDRPCGKDRWNGAEGFSGKGLPARSDADVVGKCGAPAVRRSSNSRASASRGQLAVGGEPVDAVETRALDLRSECLDRGLCAAVRDLQEAQPPLARPRAAPGAAHQPEATRFSSLSRGRPIQRTARTVAHPAVGCNSSEGGSASHVVFLSDYDMLLTEQLVQGVDVWLNTPRRPWEASERAV